MKGSKAKTIELVESASNLLEVSIDVLADAFYLFIIKYFSGKLTITDGNIEDIAANYDIINELTNSIKNTFFTERVVAMLGQIANSFLDLDELNDNYFSTLEGKDITTISDVVFKEMHDAFGFSATTDAINILPGAWLASTGDLESAYQAVREQAIRAVSQKIPWATFQKQLEETIKGVGTIPGIIKSHFKTIAWDVYANYDRTVALKYADTLGYRAAIYEGGLIDRSRDFCIERDGKVFTFDEIKAFGTPEDKYDSYTDKAAGKFDGKSYAYDPFIDQGGYRCRHAYSYIPDRLAIRLRPELKEIWNAGTV